MPDRTCVTPRCGKAPAPHRARIGAGHWCMSCLDHWRRKGTDPGERSALRVGETSCPVVEDGERCGRPVAVKRTGWCNMHRKVAQNNGGDPTARQRAGRGALLAFVQRAAVATGDECLIPPGWEQRPIVKLDGRAMTAARAVWTIAHGEPADRDVLHTCNGGSGAHGCISIRHLYLGDDAQNARDKIEAGRQPQGEGHAMHVLTEADVREIRRRHVSGTGPYNRGNTRDLADEFSVAVTTVRNAVNGRSWRYLDGGGHGGDRGD